MPLTLGKNDHGTQLEYESEAIMRQRFSEDLLLFDLASEGRIIAARAPHHRMRLGTSFLSLLSEGDRHSLQAYLLDYQTAPVVLDTQIGIAVVFPALMSNASLGLALIPHLDRNIVLDLLAREIKVPCLWTKELKEKRLVFFEKRDTTAFSAVLHQTLDCIGEQAFAPFPIAQSIENDLEQQLYRLSYLTGCPVHLLQKDRLTQFGEFNMALFSAFSLVTLLLCRRISPLREAFVSLENHSAGAALSIRIPCPPDAFAQTDELVWLFSLCDRKNLIFECTPQENQYHLCFVPIDVDWSHIELKQPTQYGFMY